MKVFVPVKTFTPFRSGTLDESLASDKDPEAMFPAARFVMPAPLPESVLAAFVIITVPVYLFVPVKTFVPLRSGTLDESLASLNEPDAILPAERFVMPAPLPESVLAAFVIITVPV